MKRKTLNVITKVFAAIMVFATVLFLIAPLIN